MPIAHTIRRWLWRANLLLALGVLAVWVHLAVGDHDAKALPLLPTPAEEVQAERLGPDITFDEMVALVRPFHGWGPAREQAPPPVLELAPGLLPLGAYEVGLWIRDPGLPDLVLLSPKDPAQREVYILREGVPSEGVAIESIREDRKGAHITVTRGSERFTYDVAVRPLATPADERIVRLLDAPRPNHEHLASRHTEPPRLDVKVLPFYASNGKVAGARVTGVRPGSALARAGLVAGDVIVCVDGEDVADAHHCRARLEDSDHALSLRVIRFDGPSRQTLEIDV